MKNIRIHNFKSKTRIVLDFSLEPQKLAIRSLSNKKTQIILNNTDILDTINKTINLDSKHYINVNKANNRLEVNINVSKSQLRFFTVNDPDRLIVDILCIKSKSLSQYHPCASGKEIYPGITHKIFKLRGPVIINVLDIDLNEPMIDIMPVTASTTTLFSKSSVNQIVSNQNAIAGINASFFKPPNGLPLGTLIINTKIITGSIFNRVALVIDKDNRAYLDKVKFKGYFILPDNTKLQFHNINQPRLSLDGYMLYSAKWKAYVPKTLRNELQIAVVNGKIVQKTTGSIKVPYNGYVITGPNKDKFKALKIGDSIDITTGFYSYVPDLKHAIGGGPYLIKDGKIFIDVASQHFRLNSNKREPRTAVGITAQNHLLLVTVDGRQNKSIGMSFYSLARFLQTLGVVQAMNFDGGSSTQMSIRGRTVNNPTVNGGASISTGIIIKNSDISIANKLPN